MGRATSNFFLAPPPGALGRGQKVKYHLISITKSISKIFIPNFVCVLTNERYKTYQTDILSPGSCPRGGTWGAQGVKKFFFSNIVMWHIKSTGMTSRTKCKLNFHPRVKLVTLGEVKGQISLNFGYHVNFIDFYTKLCVCSHKK